MSDKAMLTEMADNTDSHTVSLDHDCTEQVSAAPTATIHNQSINQSTKSIKSILFLMWPKQRTAISRNTD